MLDDLAWGDDRLRHDQAVAVIVHTADLESSHRVRSRYAADVLPYSLFDIGLYPVISMFGAEYDVVEEGRICVCHFNRRYATGTSYTAFRGLKPTAIFIVPLRGRGKGSACLWANATCPWVATNSEVPAYI